MKLEQKIKNFITNDEYRALLLILLIFFAFFAVYTLTPTIEGDSVLYVNSIEVLKGNPPTSDFIPMMILSTYLGLRLIMFLTFFTGNIALAWVLLNATLYVALGLSFYALLKRFFKDTQLAFIGTLLLALNYAPISFGMAYMMDIGGWVAYIASLYFSYRYLEESGGVNRWLYLSAVTIGIGGIYKEYAFVAYVVLFGLLVFKNWKQWGKIIKYTALTGLLAFGPFVLMNLYTYIKFDHYTYLDWFFHNQGTYTYQNRPVEFIKSFGSIFNIGWLLFGAGLLALFKQYRHKLTDPKILYVALVAISGLAVFLWPVVTRVLFVTIPLVILISCFGIQKIPPRWRLYFMIIFLLVYGLAGFLMDAYILNFVNLPF